MRTVVSFSVLEDRGHLVAEGVEVTIRGRA
jgi:hypothetical protein